MFNSLKADKNVIFELTRRSVKTQYRGSFLGAIWTILNPLLTMLVMWLVFVHFFGKDDPYYPIYLLSGNILFSALRASTTQSLHSLDANKGILLRTKVNPYVFPTSYTLSSLVNFAFSLIALIPFMIWLSIAQGVNLFTYRLLFVLLMAPALFMFELGIGLFLGALYVFFRDVAHLYTVFLLLWNYLTPIFWKPTESMGATAKVICRFNPMYHFTAYFRECVYLGAAGADPMTGNMISGATPYLPEFTKLGYIYLFGIVSLALGIGFYKLLKQKMLMRL